tara:strand:- start:577 stop:897 length:321 start_codon:yes stop_codon:yes gene_type:complete
MISLTNTEQIKDDNKTRNKVVKKPRKLTAYNLFVREKMPEIKTKYQQKDQLKAIGALWQIHKNLKLTNCYNTELVKYIEDTYPDLSIIEKEKLLDTLLKLDIYWKT